MKENNDRLKGKKGTGTAHHKRWHRNIDGTYLYVGVCPFNRAVCRLVNTITKIRPVQGEG